MTDRTNERRRAPRVSTEQESRVSLAVSLPVEVLDISPTGVLLGSRTELAVGDRARLTATLGARVLSVVIEVRHVSIETKARGGIRYRAGAWFVAPTPEQSLLLEQLLGAERT
jgi:hypothetical protein